jgi:biotin carboxyl carrier protein
MSEQDTQVLSEDTGSVWKIEMSEGDLVAEDDVIMILECMKMEIPVMAPAAGVIKSIQVAESDNVSEDQVLAIIG